MIYHVVLFSSLCFVGIAHPTYKHVDPTQSLAGSTVLRGHVELTNRNGGNGNARL